MREAAANEDISATWGAMLKPSGAAIVLVGLLLMQPPQEKTSGPASPVPRPLSIRHSAAPQPVANHNHKKTRVGHAGFD
ncbi:hypothetical protein [Lysobacter sp. Root690]|uniref:hypothetical protein n=1 Tax=Lysobacter sp. Root690 TaxID=1736588 RepID=UPI0006FE286F|nr:hypothetical protein [Lysobacter sp. Root690]KRB03447.1 hypothetical protein ASD86_21520 [Lysobacter sp. Root690]